MLFSRTYFFCAGQDFFTYYITKTLDLPQEAPPPYESALAYIFDTPQGRALPDFVHVPDLHAAEVAELGLPDAKTSPWGAQAATGIVPAPRALRHPELIS